MSDIYQDSLKIHQKYQGKIGIKSLFSVKNRQDLALAYTPGVAQACREISKDPKKSFDLTLRGRSIAVISDGSAVLGLGDIGPEAAMPVMEGKTMLMKEFADIDAIPIVVNTQDPSEIIEFVKNIAPSFAGINLEDISAPRCFQIEEALQDIGIPVFHDDQHGTAIVVAAGLQNAAKVVDKPFNKLKVVINGAGSAGLAIAKMLLGADCNSDSCHLLKNTNRVADVIIVDRAGAIYSGRDGLNVYKQAVAGISNKNKVAGSLAEVVKGADVLIGVSKPKLFTKEIIQSMAKDAIIFAMANPEPETMPDLAKSAGAKVVATGRSDFPNQVNNVLAFPGIFRAVLDGRLSKITTEMKIIASKILADMVENPSINNIIPDPFTPNLSQNLADKILEEILN